MSESESDERIAKFIQTGRPEAFGVLVDRYEDKLIRYGRHFLAKEEDIEDSVQDIFLRAYENIMSFDVDQRFSPWLYRIAHNVFVNKLRSKKRDRLAFIDLDTLISHPVYEEENEQEREQEKAEWQNLLEKSLQKIEPKYQEPLVLHYLEGLSYKEIADVLSVPVSTVGVRIHRGKEELRHLYNKKHE